MVPSLEIEHLINDDHSTLLACSIDFQLACDEGSMVGDFAAGRDVLSSSPGPESNIKLKLPQRPDYLGGIKLTLTTCHVGTTVGTSVFLFEGRRPVRALVALG